MIPRGRAARFGTAAATVLVAVSVAACDQLQAADDVVTPIHVVREPEALWVRAPELSAPETLVVLCPSRPESDAGPLNDPGPARVELAETCHPYGRFASTDGLDARLAFADLGGASRADLDAAPQWWIVLVGVRDGVAGAYYETQVEGGPIEPGTAPSG